MKHALFLLLLIASSPVFAEELQKITMSLAYVAESNAEKPEYIILINGSLAFKTTDKFIQYATGLPAGSEITWAPGCCRTGGEPFLSSKDDIDKLIKALDDKKIKFIRVPSG